MVSEEARAKASVVVVKVPPIAASAICSRNLCVHCFHLLLWSAIAFTLCCILLKSHLGTLRRTHSRVVDLALRVAAHEDNDDESEDIPKHELEACLRICDSLARWQQPAGGHR